MTFNQILVPIDFSPTSEAALQSAVTLAESFEATISVLRAWDAPSFMGLEGPISGSALITEPLRVEVKTELERVDEDLRRFLLHLTNQEQPKVLRYARAGEPSKVIVEFAKEHGIDLIVMG